MSLANMKLHCLFSHPVTSPFEWSTWSTMKKYVRGKYQWIMILIQFPQLSSSPCYHGHQIESLLVNLSYRFVVTDFGCPWILSFHLDLFLLVFFWERCGVSFGFGVFCWWRGHLGKKYSSYLMIQLDPSFLLSYSSCSKYNLKNLFFLCIWATTNTILSQFLPLWVSNTDQIKKSYCFYIKCD